MKKNGIKISKTGKIIIIVLLVVIVGLVVGIFAINYKSNKESHYVSIDDSDDGETTHVVNDDGTVSHMQSESVADEWAAYAEFEFSGNNGIMHLLSNNKEFDTIPEAEEGTFRYYLINDDNENVNVYTDLISLNVENLAVVTDASSLSSTLLTYHTDTGESDEDTGNELKNSTSYGLYSNHFKSIDYKYLEYVLGKSVLGDFSIAFDTNDVTLNDKYQCNHIVFNGTTDDIADIKLSFDENNNIIFSSTVDIDNLSCSFTYEDSSVIDEYDLGDSYYAELSSCDMTYNKNTKMYEFVWSNSLDFEKQYLGK